MPRTDCVEWIILIFHCKVAHVYRTNYYAPAFGLLICSPQKKYIYSEHAKLITSWTWVGSLGIRACTSWISMLRSPCDQTINISFGCMDFAKKNWACIKLTQICVSSFLSLFSAQTFWINPLRLCLNLFVLALLDPHVSLVLFESTHAMPSSWIMSDNAKVRTYNIQWNIWKIENLLIVIYFSNRTMIWDIQNREHKINKFGAYEVKKSGIATRCTFCIELDD